jgi:hypothetical protein
MIKKLKAIMKNDPPLYHLKRLRKINISNIAPHLRENRVNK